MGARKPATHLGQRRNSRAAAFDAANTRSALLTTQQKFVIQLDATFCTSPAMGGPPGGTVAPGAGQLSVDYRLFGLTLRTLRAFERIAAAGHADEIPAF